MPDRLQDSCNAVPVSGTDRIDGRACVNASLRQELNVTHAQLLSAKRAINAALAAIERAQVTITV
jgi:hypothetical protein